MFLEQVLVELVKKGASLDEICSITGVEQDLISATLVRLELLGVIEEVNPRVDPNT